MCRWMPARVLPAGKVKIHSLKKNKTLTFVTKLLYITYYLGFTTGLEDWNVSIIINTFNVWVWHAIQAVHETTKWTKEPTVCPSLFKYLSATTFERENMIIGALQCSMSCNAHQPNSFISLYDRCWIIKREQYGCRRTVYRYYIFFSGSGIWARGLFCCDKKEIKIQSGFTKTSSSGWSTKINTQPHQPSQCSQKTSWFLHLKQSSLRWYGEMLNMHFRFELFILLHHSDAAGAFSQHMLSETSSCLNHLW